MPIVLMDHVEVSLINWVVNHLGAPIHLSPIGTIIGQPYVSPYIYRPSSSYPSILTVFYACVIGC